MEYDVILKESEEGVAVWVPALPGCASQGATETEALDNIRDAIENHLAVLSEIQHESGTEIRTVTVKVA